MRISYLLNQYPQPSQTFIRREIRALEGLGVQVVRITLRAWDGEPVDPADVEEKRKTRVVLSVGVAGLAWGVLRTLATGPVHFLRGLRLAVAAGWGSDRGLLRHLVYFAEACVLRGWLMDPAADAGRGAEHVHAHFGTNAATVAMLCRAIGGPPYSFTVHGPEEFDQPVAMRLGEKIRRSAFAIGVSDFTRSQILRWCAYGDWRKVHVVRCGLDPELLHGSEREGMPLPQARRLVCVGRLTEQKGQLLLLEAAKRLCDEGLSLELVLIGDGPMRGEVERLVTTLGLVDTVRLTGWISNAAVREQTLASRALVLPSFAEGLPVVLMEALAAGRPVISTYVAGIPELVEHRVSGLLVPAGSVEALVSAMRQMLSDDPDRLTAMAAAGAARVAERHDARVEAARLAGLFRHYGQLSR